MQAESQNGSEIRDDKAEDRQTELWRDERRVWRRRAEKLGNQKQQDEVLKRDKEEECDDYFIIPTIFQNPKTNTDFINSKKCVFVNSKTRWNAKR